MHHVHRLHRTQPLQRPPLSQPMQTSQRFLEPAIQYEQQQGSSSYQGHQTRKRSILADTVEPMDRKRWRGAEAGSSGSFAWLGLLGTATGGLEESEHGYFERRSTSQYDPATPPLDVGPLHASISASPFQFPSHQDVTARSTHEQGYNFTPRREGVRTEMDVEARSELQSAHEGVTIRSLSPAPSSPSGSVNERVGYEGLSCSNHSHCPTTNPDPGYLDSEQHPHLNGRRVSTGRSNFVMGFRPGCERCQRREKGHFAHFE